MTKTLIAKYKCDYCQKEETDERQLLYWLKITTLRDDLIGGYDKVLHPQYVRHFCNRACLVAWADDR